MTHSTPLVNFLTNFTALACRTPPEARPGASRPLQLPFASHPRPPDQRVPHPRPPAGANLTRALLYGANLTNAELDRADLTFAHLSGADLTHADLAGSDLTDVRGLRMEQVGSAHITARTVLPPDIGTAAGPSCTT
ncbi:pentapeptide repeat-containing protein [Streptomyces sp. NPDC002586]